MKCTVRADYTKCGGKSKPSAEMTPPVLESVWVWLFQSVAGAFYRRSASRKRESRKSRRASAQRSFTDCRDYAMIAASKKRQQNEKNYCYRSPINGITVPDASSVVPCRQAWHLPPLVILPCAFALATIHWFKCLGRPSRGI